MNLKKIENFIDKQKVSFICSIDDEKCPNVKAMLKPRKRKGLKEFYFSTNTSSMRVKQYKGCHLNPWKNLKHLWKTDISMLICVACGNGQFCL